MTAEYMPSKDPDDTRPYFIPWCDRETGTNTSGDNGELQGDTISSSSWSVASGITKDSDDTDAVEIDGISYGINTVAAIWLSDGTDETDYSMTNTIVTANGRVLSKTIIVPVREH